MDNTARDARVLGIGDCVNFLCGTYTKQATNRTRCRKKIAAALGSPALRGSLVAR